MQCTDIKCPYYRGPEKRDWAEKMVGIKGKIGGCNYNYCKLRRGKFTK